jgi:hypothetical protein
VLDQHLLTDAIDRAPQLAEAVRPGAEGPEDQRLPLAPDDVDGGIPPARVDPAGGHGGDGFSRTIDILWSPGAGS